MRLVYLYLRKRNYGIGHFRHDGHYHLLGWLLKNRIIDEAVAVLDCYGMEHEHLRGKNGVDVHIVKDLANFDMRPDDVIWIRGGWKPWIPLIEKWRARGNWILYYDANTGHRSWPFWHVLLWDLAEGSRMDLRGSDLIKERAWLYYPKPVSPIFQPKALPIKYDVCVGASHIYDRKGQFRMFRAAIEYERMYGEPLRCVMPGTFYSREKNTLAMKTALQNYPEKYPWVNVTGELPRKDLVDVFNQSRIFVHLCHAGHSDRGAIEAGSCGCHMIVGGAKYHSPYMTAARGVTLTINDFNNPKLVAAELHQFLQHVETFEKPRQIVADYFKHNVSIPNGAGPVLEKLLGVVRAWPTPCREALEALL